MGIEAEKDKMVASHLKFFECFSRPNSLFFHEIKGNGRGYERDGT